MNSSEKQTKHLPPSVRSALSGLQWYIRAYVLLEGLALALVWLGLTFWAGLALDYLPVLVGATEMPLAARAVLLTFIALVLAYVLYRWVLRRCFARMADHSMALLLERRFGHFHDSLVTAVELSEHPDHAAEFNQDMLEHTSEEALAEMDDVRGQLWRVFRFSPLIAKLSLAVLTVVPVIVFFFVNPSAAGLWVSRMYLLEDKPWPRHTQLEEIWVELHREPVAGSQLPPVAKLSFVDGVVKVARGANVAVHARAVEDKVIPETCTLYYESDEGDRDQVTMDKRGVSDYSYSEKPFRGILSTINFDIRGGDHRVRDYRILVVDSPAIVETTLDCVFPGYLVNEELSTWLPRSVPLTSGTQLPIGTELTIRCRANKELRQVEFYDPATKQRSTLSLEGNADRRTFSYIVTELGESLTLDVTLFDADGVISERPHRLFITGIEDQPPLVTATLHGIGTAVTPNVLIPVKGTVGDDYDVAKTWFHVKLNETEDYKSPIEPQAGGAIDAQLDFRQKRSDEEVEIKPGDKLVLSLQAEDKFDLQGAVPNVGSGERFQLEVVTDDELLSRLDRRELSLRQRFEQIMDEMILMRDSLARVKSADADPGDAARDPADEQVDPAKAAEDAHSLRVLRTQRAITQSKKSAQEVLGVAASFDDIRLELENNRVDSEDRKSRLKDQISEPLNLVATAMYPELDRILEELEKTLVARQGADQLAQDALRQADDILLELDKVLQKMFELEDFNQLINLVRSLRDDHEKLMERTKRLRKQQALDLLK